MAFGARLINDKLLQSAVNESGPIVTFESAFEKPFSSLLVNITPAQSGSGDPSPTNIRPISGWSGANIYVSPTTDVADATTYSISWSDSAGTVYGGTLDVLSGKLTVDRASINLANVTWSLRSARYFRGTVPNILNGYGAGGFDDPCSCYPTFYPASGLIANIPDKVYISGWNNTGKYIIIKDTSYATVNDFVSSLTGQTAIYHIEPVEHTLTPTEITTLLGINNVWADCGDVALTLDAVRGKLKFKLIQ